MKKNFIIALVLVILCFALTITAIVFNITMEAKYTMYVAMGASVAGFLSCLFGLNSWKEK